MSIMRYRKYCFTPNFNVSINDVICGSEWKNSENEEPAKRSFLLKGQTEDAGKSTERQVRESEEFDIYFCSFDK